MRILLTSNASYAPPRGGSTRSNLVWLRHLVTQGHQCRVVSAALGDDTQHLTEGIHIRSVRNLALRPDVLGQEIAAFKPDFVLVSSEDLSHVLLREAGTAASGRIVYLAHTPQFFPFGPESWNPDAAATEIIRSARSIVAIGAVTAEYISTHLGIRPAVIHPPIYGAPPFPRFGGFHAGWILMINPCQVKGLPIFLDLARTFPHLPFAALTGWGTTTDDREALAALPNVRLLGSVPNIEEVLQQTRILIMPSLWYEGFGLIAMEALLRAIPVIASDSGGLVEAKRGTGFIVPVNPIQHYQNEFDETHMPKPVIPVQDMHPWEEALRQLVEDQATYEAESERSRAAALAFVSHLDAADLEKHLLGLLHQPLSILLLHNSFYYPGHGGGDKSNRLLMEALAERGHRVRVIARGNRLHQFQRLGVEVRTFPLETPLRPVVQNQIRELNPDVVLTSTDDAALLLFDAARSVMGSKNRLVHLVRATIAVPFGPDSSSASPARTEVLRGADAIVGVSEYVAGYVRQQGGLDAVHVPISLMDPGEPEDLGRFDNPYVLMVNPCAVKGIAIFVELAARLPDVRFAAVPTWGTNAADLALLHAQPNITILPAVDEIDQVLRQARVVLVPSLWAEARSRIVVEAMLRGIPVMASDVGGIPEAKLGVPYLLPVRKVTQYRPSLDENMVPVAEVATQDVLPWQAVLEHLTRDPEHWQDVAQRSREAGLAYLRGLSAEPFEMLLRDVVQRPRKATQTDSPEQRLSPDRQKLLAIRLRQRAWFPTLDPSRRTGLRLFCFPHAGAGALSYRSWIGHITGVMVVPVQLPGRETRLGEAPFEEMPALVEALRVAIRPFLDAPFAFFGHSMGAGIAFELARQVRPAKLIVSAARAPQLRSAVQVGSSPSDDELLAGMSFDAQQLVLPVLRADLKLYRNYRYREGELLDIPVIAYGGETDPNLSGEHLEGWRHQTSGPFFRREFPGGHLYLQSHPNEVLTALATDLSSSLR